MTIEELEAVVSDLQAEKEAMQAKNKEILSELKKAKAKSGEFDMEKFLQVQEDLDNALAENAKLQGESKLTKKEFEKLQAELSDKDKSIHKLLVSDGITKELASLGIDDIETLMPYFERNATVENGVALLNGKPIKESMTEWADGAGKRYIPTTTSTGGGAGGGSNNPTKPNNDISGLSPVEMMKAGRNNPPKK